MKTMIRSLIASVLAFGLMAVSLQANAHPPEDYSDNPLLQQVMTDYDS